MAKADKTDKKPQLVSMMSILNNLKKAHGNDAVFSGDDIALETADPISTGSYVLDDAIGILGVPRGRITQLAGAEASGKTFMAFQIVKQWQMKDPANWAVWIDAECTYNKKWAETLGVDTSRIHIIPKTFGAEIFDILCGRPNPKKPEKKDKLGLLDELLAVGPDHKCGVIVLDSVAGMIPPVEAAYDVGHQNMAPMARFLPAACRRLLPMIKDTNVAFIAINQLRVDPSIQYGDPAVSPGGKALKFFSRLMINMAKVRDKDKLILDKDELPIGHTVKAKIQKNSFAIPRDAEFVIKYLEGVSNHNVEMVDLAIKYGIIERPNNVMYHYKEDKWKGRETVEDALKDKKLFNEIWEQVKLARETSLTVESETVTKEILGLEETEAELGE